MYIRHHETHGSRSLTYDAAPSPRSHGLLRSRLPLIIAMMLPCVLPFRLQIPVVRKLGCAHARAPPRRTDQWVEPVHVDARAAFSAVGLEGGHDAATELLVHNGVAEAQLGQLELRSRLRLPRDLAQRRLVDDLVDWAAGTLTRGGQECRGR